MRLSVFQVACVVLCFFHYASVGQTSKADSLHAVLSGGGKDTNRVIAFNELGFYYKSMGLFDTALYYSQQGQALARELNYWRGQARSLTNIGNIYADQGINANALYYYGESFRIAEANRHLPGMAISLNNMGLVYDDQGDYAKALEHYFRSLKIKEEFGDKKGIGFTYNNIGNVYFDKKDFEKAQEYYLMSLRIKQELSDRKGEARTLENIANVNILQKNFSKALEYYLNSLKIKEETGNKKEIAITLFNIGAFYEMQSDFSRAEEYLLKSLKIREAIGDKYGVTMSLLDIGQVNMKQNKYAKAISYLERAEEEAKALGSMEWLRSIYDLLSKIYAETGQPARALDYYKMHIAARDSIFNEENTKRIVQAEMNFAFDQKLRDEKARQEKEQLLYKAEAEAQKKQRNNFIVAFALVLALAVVSLLFLRQKLMSNRLLDRQKKIIEEKNKDITDSIHYALRIQHTILPSESYFRELLPESFVLYKPKDIVSGDFYFLGSPTTNYGVKLVVFGAIDCTGHGVPGAFLTIIGKTFLQLGLTEKTVNSCGEALDYLNKGVIEMLRNEKDIMTVKDGMDASLCAINFETLQMDFAGANNPGYLVRGKELILLEPDKRGIGETHGENTPASYTNRTMALQKGDCVYVFTDGYADQFGGPKGKKFMYKQLKELLISIHDKSMEEQKQVLDEKITAWKGELDQVDDILIMGVRV